MRSPCASPTSSRRAAHRTPPASEAQRRFILGIYLLFEDGREPDKDKLAQARGIEAALVQYFFRRDGRPNDGEPPLSWIPGMPRESVPAAITAA